MKYTVSDTSKASPDMTDAEFMALREDIRRNGQLVPILIRGIEIIDGRKRALACHELGIEPKTIDLSSNQDPEAVAYSLNILRTHYNTSQRGMYAARRATATVKDASSMGLAARGKPTTNLQSVGKTVAQAAQETGVSPSTVAAAKRILRTAAPEVVTAVEAGKMTLHTAEQINGEIPKPDQPKAVTTVLKESRGKQRQESARILGIWDGTKRPPKRNVPECIERGLDQLSNILDALEELFASLSAKERTERDWAERIETNRTRLSRLIRSARNGGTA